jgi:hypothetical protein
MPAGSPAPFTLSLPSGEPKRITMVLDCFHGGGDEARSDATLGIMLNALFEHDRLYLLEHPETPSIYDAGVEYVEEPEGCEDWQDVPTCLRLGIGDCEDFACWLAAELDVRHGIAARPAFTKQTMQNGQVLYHIVVRLPDGVTLPDGTVTTSIGAQGFTMDPSRMLGMV